MIAVPNLDTIDFDALFEQGRALIPRYAPEWTDHNIHDPGIMLLDLLAWIVDQQMYRLGFVGDSHLIAYAALLGVQRRGAQPAQGLIWPDGPLPASVDLAAQAVLVSPAQPDLRFLVDAPLHLTDAVPERIEIRRSGMPPVVTGFDQRIVLAPGDSLDLVFDRPLALGALAHVALGIAIERRGTAPGAEAPHLWGPLIVDYGVGGAMPQRIAIIADGSQALAQSGVVILAIPPGGSGESVLRLRTDLGYFPLPPVLTRLALNVLPIRQVEMAVQQTLGESAGLPDQIWPFDSASIVEGTELAISTGEGGASVPWTAAADLDRSGPADNHYLLDAARGTIRFGNGINGRVPPAGAQILVAQLARTQGALGNLGKGRTWRLAGVDGTYGHNPVEMAGGAAAWTMDDLVDALQARAARRDAMLTNAEMRAAAQSLPGFGMGRVDILPGFFPPLPAHPVCGARTLVVRPDGGMPAAPAFVAAVADALSPRRVLGERLSVVSPVLVTVDIAASLLIAEVSEADLRVRIEARLRARLSDGAGLAEIAPWPIGRPVTPGEIEALIAATDGVQAVTALSLARAGEEAGAAALVLGPTEIAVAGQIGVTVAFAGDGA